MTAAAGDVEEESKLAEDSYVETVDVDAAPAHFPSGVASQGLSSSTPGGRRPLQHGS